MLANKSTVEAHGTGTPVGDPAEYQSILQVLGGRSVRSSAIPLGSIKGLIGHTECASGVMALIKVLLLLYRGEVPPQASFTKLSSGIKASPDDMLEINTKMVPWRERYRAALINNYGASGSNASMIVAQPPERGGASIEAPTKSQPFWLAAFDQRALKEYCLRLRAFVRHRATDGATASSLADLSYSLSRQSNRSLPQKLIFKCESFQELDEILH